MTATRPVDSAGRMPLRSHLRELRKRLFLVAAGLAVGAVAGWLLYKPVFEALIDPLVKLAAERDDLVTINFSSLFASFDMQLQVSLFLSVLLTSPWWIYHLWAFITPGLTRKERRYAVGFLGAAVPLFLSGALVAWWALPHAVRLLLGFTPMGAGNIIDAPTYMSFVLRLLLAFGIAFLLPVVMVALNFVGLVKGATWRKGWRWAVVGVTVFAAIATPTPDPWTMLLVMAPMVLLYFAAVWVCLAHDKRVARRRAERTD